MRERAHRITDVNGPTSGSERQLAYTEWGDSGNPKVALCVHGLTRNARDFDALAGALSASHRVLCVDVAGRGRSDWLSGAEHYRPETYLADLRSLLADLGVSEVDWVGTSMGGVLGMRVAGSKDLAERRVVRRLVLNDIGPFLPAAGMAPIADRVGRAPPFADLAAAETYQKEVCAEWGALTDAQWQHLARHSVRAAEGGGYAYHHDPAIGDAVRAGGPMADVAFWELWDRIACPVLVMRGARSEILLAETPEEMKSRGPGATVIELPGIGHAPSLMRDDEIAAVVGWLRVG